MRDAEFVFKLNEKGRWINDTPKENENVKAEFVNGDLHFRTFERNPPRKGDQFYWYYGEDYQRPWLCACGNVSEMCEVSNKANTFCSVECQIKFYDE
jgi:hypothetical protein